MPFFVASMRHRTYVPLLVAAALFLGSCARTAPAPPPETPPAFVFRPEPPPEYRHDGIRIATLNTEFLFDGLGDEGEASFPHKGDPEKARLHRERIARIIRLLRADVVMLEEVENDTVLYMMIEESLDDLGYRVYFVQGNDRFTGQDVALLSRLPIDEVGRTDERVRVAGERRMQGVSKNMYARLMLGGVPTTLIGLHFYARPTDPTRKERREAQAEVIRRLAVREIEAGRAVVVLGDFNDYDDVTLDLAGHRPITDVLHRIKAAGPEADDDLHNVLSDVPQIKRFTNFWDRNHDGAVERNELSAIDHILLSPALSRRTVEVHYVHAHDPFTYTDHFPVVVTVARDDAPGG